MTSRVLLFVLAISLPAELFAQAPDVRRLLDSPQFKAATAFIQSDEPRFVKELIELTEIPAPPFKEERRAKAYLEKLRASGLTDVEMDQEGNVMGVRKGSGGASMLAIVAHLDTVFPEGTDVKVKREGTKLSAPGVGDNTRGLALMLAVIRAMAAAKFQTANDILFVGNVGEEGEGDLRGTKFLLQKGKYKDRIKQFIALDGDAQEVITHGGVGSRRYRVTFKGPGGHSYSSFGLVSPAFAMGNAIARFSRLKVPQDPKTTYSVGLVSGGTSVNSIPFETAMVVDMRSTDCGELKKLDTQFLALVKASVDEENKARSTTQGSISADTKVIGDRPCGVTALTTPLVQTASAVVRAFAMTPSYDIGSTDANVPMSLGIPAINIGSGVGGRAHALDEWVTVEPEANVQAVQVAMAIILTSAGIK